MALLDLVRSSPGGPVQAGAEVPDRVQRRIGRGRPAMKVDAPKRRLCMRFERGDSYTFINGKGILSFQSTVTNPDGSGKPPHRIRNTYNFIRPIVQGKVSAATQRIPAYEVLPSTTDQQRIAAANLAEKAAMYGFKQWGVSRARVKAANYAIGGGGEGFALPYFEPNVGPYVEVQDPATGEPRMVGRGEIKIVVLNGNEVYWEPGCSFEESRWWGIERARPIDDVKEIPGFKGELKADASTSDIPNDRKASDQMVLVTEYFERPCPQYPDGRHFVIAGGKTIVPEGAYPLRDADGQVLDEPILHRLAWDVDGETDRDFGLTWQLVDCERSAQDCINKLLEWKNRCLMPQMSAAINSIVNRRTDEPGAITYYRGQQKPDWERAIEPPQALFQLLETLLRIMRAIAADEELQAAPNVAARTVQAVLEESRARWQTFLGSLADWDAGVMRHCLMLCARYYTEPRLLEIRGRDGWEPIPDFKGADLMGEVDVRLMASSLVPYTRQGVQDQLSWIAQTFPGWLNPQDALAALQAGSLDRLSQSYWLDQGRANTIIQKIRDGTVLDMPSRGQTDPTTGQPMVDPVSGQPMEVPGYMPSDQDNLQIWERVFADWMKTDDYTRVGPEGQTIAQDVWDGIQALKMMQAQRQAALQTQMAEQQGLANAAKPQAGGKPMPSQPALPR